MKQAILKTIIKDLNMAGIFDIPANSFTDLKKLESSEILNKSFKINKKENSSEKNPIKEDLPSSEEVSNEINNLFSSFKKQSKSLSEENSEEQTELKVFKAEDKQKTQRKPKHKKNYAEAPSNTTNNSIVKETKPQAPSPETFIELKKVEGSKLAIIIPIKNEKSLKQTEEYTLLNNILKTMNSSVKNISIIFINPEYKKITLEDTNYTEKLANKVKESIKLLSEDIVFCFGENCLKLALNNEATIKKYGKQLIKDSKEEKILLANYSLSAMLNTPKYKAITWANILLLKDKLKNF